MEITEVRIKLVDISRERLKAFCSVTFDHDFVIRDLKIIDGTNGAFVAMPSRKLADRCQKCGAKNHLRARFCNECGARLNEDRASKDAHGRIKLHADVAHPINAACRERIQKAVLKAYEEELEASKRPGYKPARLDDNDEYDSGDYDSLIADLKREAAARRQAHRHDASAEAASQTQPEQPEPEEPKDMPKAEDQSDFGAGIL